jgi:hypothetical protein
MRHFREGVAVSLNEPPPEIDCAALADFDLPSRGRLDEGRQEPLNARGDIERMRL